MEFKAYPRSIVDRPKVKPRPVEKELSRYDKYMDARCQLPWPVGVNYPDRWKRGMFGLAFRL